MRLGFGSRLMAGLLVAVPAAPAANAGSYYYHGGGHTGYGHGGYHGGYNRGGFHHGLGWGVGGAAAGLAVGTAVGVAAARSAAPPAVYYAPRPVYVPVPAYGYY